MPKRRLKLLLALGVLLLRPGGVPPFFRPTDALFAQTNEESQRREDFLKAREQMRALPPTPKPSAKPSPAPPPYNPWRARQPNPPPGTTQAPAPSAPPEPQPTPAPGPSAGETGASGREDAPPVIIIEKSGQAEDAENPEAVEPPPPVKKRGFWARLFGGGGEPEENYRFLTRRVLGEINNAPVRRGRWKYTVVHNSGTRQGSAKAFDYYHRHTRHMPNGMAYHFVIGNGTTTGDGAVEIGERWRRQINGGHVHSDYLNNIAIGICLVGDFNRDQPTKAQYAALQELVNYLRKRVGRVDRRLSIVKAHKEINPVPTDCPGSRFSYGWLHRTFD